MEWILTWKDSSHTINIPSYLLAKTVFTAKVNAKEVLCRWNPNHRTLTLCERKEGLVLERCFRVRNACVEVDPQTEEKLIRFSLHGVGSSLIEARAIPLSQSRAVRSASKRKKVYKQYSPLTGKVAKLYIKLGDPVKKGDLVAIIEAMKMENKILSELTGVVSHLNIVESGKINMGEELFTSAPAKTEWSITPP